MLDDELDMINMLLFAKDKHDASGRSYHEFASTCKQLPPHYKLKRRISELKELWNTQPTSNNTCGVKPSLEDCLHLRINQLHKVAQKDEQFRTQQTIRVKLSGDGTNIGKRLHVMNFTFTLLDEPTMTKYFWTSLLRHVLLLF